MTTETKLDCVFCKEVFQDKETLIVHFRKHGDPNFNTKPKNKAEELINENVNDESEVISCDVCNEVFPTISKAITHKHKAHPDHDAKYFCPFCGKLFTMKHLYNKHIQSNHDPSEATDSKDFHCDCCAVLFYVPAAMHYHNKFFHRQDTEVPAVGQSRKIKMYNQEMVQISYCAFCGEEFNNRINLHKHMVDDHGDENQSPTEVHRCPLCEAIFYHLDAYEIHLTFHSTEDLYSKQNKMIASITEFSLETVAPITEKVEDEVEDPNISLNPEGIDSFLQLVMGESGDNDVPDRVKSKKHKKHKKSKKASITLDEFLNMNKDVFGDGLNVHGIEEVPTQVVLKKVKGKKIPTKSEPKVVNADLAKLRKQGIVVKSKSGNSPVLANLKKEPVKQKALSTPNEILSKLINQGNSEIKIVKKSVSQNDATQEDDNVPSTSNEVGNENIPVYPDPPKEIVENNSVSESQTDNLRSSNFHEKEDLNKTEFKMLTDSDNQIMENENKNTAKENKVNLNSKNVDFEEKGPTEEENLTSIPSYSSSSIPVKTIPEDSKIEEDTSQKDIDLNNDDNRKGREDFNMDDDNDTENVANKTLDALKHLSHLITVKSVIQTKLPSNERSKEQESNKEKILDLKETEAIANKQKSVEQNVTKPVITPLSKLSGCITIKPSKQSPSTKPFSDFENEDDNEDNEKNINTNEEIHRKPLNKPISEVRRLNIKNFPINQSKILKNENIETDEDEDFKNEDVKKPYNLDILKRLTNVTAKPINLNMNQKFNFIGKPNIPQVKELKRGIDEDVEIFNIDDSDSDGNESNTSNSRIEEKQPNTPISSVLQNLGKNVVIKSNIIQTNDKEKMEDQNVKKQDMQKTINLQNKLKILSGNVTVRPSSSSPNMQNKEPKGFDDCDEDKANDSDPEPHIKVKITEMQDDDATDDEFNESHSNAIVESPHGSNSEHDDNHDDGEDDFSDFENQTKSILKKENESPTPAKNPCLENFKNFNKELTIKSLNPKKQDSEDEAMSYQKEATDELLNLNKHVTVKQTRPQNEPNNKSSQQTGGSVNQAFNKKLSTSSNQVNTVKTVKRFQSQTVIEEITTTVTKTIRTVNQSSNEVVQNRFPSKPLIRPQKINNHPSRPVQNTTARFSTPSIGTKIKNATVRNTNPNMVRPSNQLVPVRPSLNLPRAIVPSTSGMRKPAPLRSPIQKPAIGKLKISPNALNQAPKRPSNETHFTAVKKSKESFVQSSESSDFDEDSSMQFNMTQSRSDFSSVSKTLKGKGTVTATQMRSEVNTCSQQQLSRLSNVSGLKIVKTNSKQVEEKCEVNSANKNTLEALEKLQKQGLLIKKPRLDDFSEQPNSYSESDDENEK